MRINIDKCFLEQLKIYTGYGDDIILKPMCTPGNILYCEVYLKVLFMKFHLKDDLSLNHERIFKLLKLPKTSIINYEYTGNFKTKYYIETGDK